MRSSSETAPLWLTEADVAGLIDMPAALDIVRDAHRAYADGVAAGMPRSHAAFDGGVLTSVGGRVGAHAATKTWTYTPRGASPLLIVFSTEDGSVEGIVEAFTLGEFRTGATSGVATSLLARDDADRLALLGAGKQAVSQAQAVAAVRELREIRVYSRTAARRRACAERLRAGLEVEVVECDSVEGAIDGAGIVTSVTRAVEPIVHAGMLGPGVHVNAVGAFLPGRSELSADAVGACDIVVTDSLEQARRDSSELGSAVESGLLSWSSVRELGALARRPRPVRRGRDEISLFKALGTGFADAALGSAVLQRAREAGAGRPVSRHPSDVSTLPREERLT